MRHLDSFPLAQAERCVACGLCLPRCPTYLKTRTETESPRGRIALMRALAAGELALTARLESHLALCLACRACESVCPSQVGYGELIDATRAIIEASRPRPPRQRWARRLGLTLVARRRWLGAALALARGYQRSGLQALARRTGWLRRLGLARWDEALPAIPPRVRWAADYPAPGERRGAVALFTGCIAGGIDGETLGAAITLLGLAGYDVRVPPAQACCGALHQHNGDPRGAARLAARNLRAFAGSADAVVHCASGCGAELAEYGKRRPGDTAAAAFSAQARDISEFLVDAYGRAAPALAPLPRRIAVHDPCTLANVLRRQDRPYRLLRRIPEAEVFALPGNGVCCGAAGSYALTQPAMAQRLLDDKIAAIREAAPDIVATSNIGCALHLAAGLRRAGLAIEVLHPVVLLARQARAAGACGPQGPSAIVRP